MIYKVAKLLRGSRPSSQPHPDYLPSRELFFEYFTQQRKMSLAPLPPSALSFLDFYLPPKSHPNLFTTLTYAASLDSRISLGPGLRTTLSGPESKTMTHYLRSHHDAILVGAGTFVADNPGLNCQYPPADTKNALECSPLPVVLDPVRQPASFDFF